MKNLIIMVLSLLIIACGQNAQKIGEREQNENNTGIFLSKDQMDAINLTLGQMDTLSLDSAVKANGYTHLPPQNMASANAYMAGYVKSILFMEGEYVKKGQTLATLENPDFIDLQENYLQSKHQLKYLKAEWERQKILNDENLNAGKVLGKAEADYQQMLAHYNSLQKKLEMLGFNINNIEAGKFSSEISIASPITGHISKVNVSMGKYVMPSENLFEIIDKSHMHLVLNVYEHDAIKIRKAQKIIFYIPGFDKNPYQGDVYLVGQALEGDSRTVAIHAHITDEENHSFMANMYVNASIIVEQKKGLALPESAIVMSEDKLYVFFTSGSTSGTEGRNFKRVEVKVGFSNNGWTAIEPKDPIDPDAKFVTSGAFYLARAFEKYQ